MHSTKDDNHHHHHHHHRKRRNRWGHDPQQLQQQARDSSTTAVASLAAEKQSQAFVSDQDALQALLLSAREREENQKKNQPDKPQRDNHNNDNNNNRHHRPEMSTSNRARSDRNNYRDREQRERRHKKSKTAESPHESSYYGPAVVTDGKSADDKVNDDSSITADSASAAAEKPNFGLSGALAEDAADKGGIVYKGVKLKFREPPDARAPNTPWRLYVYKENALMETLHISRQSAYLLGRNTDIADIPLLHPSCSTQHAVLQYRLQPHPADNQGKMQCQPYLMDLESANGTMINGIRIDSARYYQLKAGDVLQFGASTREYVLMAAHAAMKK